METPFAEMWRWQGKISRGRYAAIGFSAMAVKYFLDRWVAGAVFHRP